MDTRIPPTLQELLTPSDQETIPEDVLNRVTRGPLREFILQADSPLSIIPIWKCLFKTYSSNGLSSSHVVAICNAISAFLDATTLSQNQQIRGFALSGSETPWISSFEVLLDRYERKPKPMRQVLTVLIKLISRHRDDSMLDPIRSRMVQLVIPNIVLCEPRSRVKACIVSLEWLIRKDALPALDMIRNMKTWMLDNSKSWTSRLEGHCIRLGVPVGSFIDEETRKSIGEDELLFYAAQVFTISLLLNSNNGDLSLSAGTLFTMLCQRLENKLYINPNTSHPLWQGPLKYIAFQNIYALEAVSNHFIYPLFKTMPSGFQSFIRSLPFHDLRHDCFAATTAQLTVLFATLQTAKELGLVQEDRSEISTAPCEPYIMDSNRIGDFLVHPETAMRVSALSLLITAPSTTKPFSNDTLQVLMENFPYMHTDSDPQYRGEVFSLIRKLLIRLRGGLAVCRRIANTGDAARGNAAEAHVQFLRWYVDFLESELEPTMSYRRHISALKMLALLLQSGLDKRIDPVHLSKLGQDQTTWDCNVEIFRPTLFRVIGDLLINPFEDIRAMALMLLAMFPRSHIQTSPANDEEKYVLGAEYSHSRFQLVKALERAERIASRTSRADHADAVARLYHVLFDLADCSKSPGPAQSWYEHKQGIVESLITTLEGSLNSNHTSFQNAIRETSVHGYISALRYIVSTTRFYSLFPSPAGGIPYWRKYQDRMMSLCQSIWIGVRAILCIDSPEGQDEDAADELKGPKDLLSCSWRALRESSMLLHAILQNLTYAPDVPGCGLVYNDFVKMGTLSFTQLAELRHRGAFSAVSQTFTACCQRCGQSNEPGVSSLPEVWYKGALKIIDDQASKLTRRSAGLPALVTGIASSQPDGPLFHRIIHECQDIARLSPPAKTGGPDVKLPQVHALNCLKDIFTNTKLGPSTEGYVMPCLKISAECLGSKIWAIRNCGLMLFKALLNRMCRFKAGYNAGLGGSSGSEPGSRVVFQKYPGLIELLAQLLQDPIPNEEQNETSPQSWELSITTERVFPALELIGEKVPSFTGEEERLLRDLVSEQFRSPVWGIREHSARIYASLLRHEQILPTICELSTIQSLPVGQNQVHGLVLCIRYSLQRLWVSSSGYCLDDSGPALLSIKEVCRNLFPYARSPFAQAALIDILNDVMEAGIRCGLEDVAVPQINELLDEHNAFNILADLLSQAKVGSYIHRSSFLLLRAIAASKTTISLVQQFSLEKLLEFIRTVSSTDPDTACWLLNHTHVHFGPHKRSQVDRMKVHISIISTQLPQAVQCAVFSSLADDLASLFENHSQIPEDFNFLQQWVTSANIPNDSNATGMWNRAMADASLRLQGCILALRLLSFKAVEVTSEFISSLNTWVQSLRSAMADETEFTTRHAASLSVKTFLSGLKLSNKHTELKPFLLETHLVLYGMLNDDDDDIRYVAAQAASILFSLQSDSPSNVTALLPLAASSKLADILAANYSASATLCAEASGRFLGLPINMSGTGTSDMTIPASVSHLLAEFQRESTVLFQEEKQNLYIEDVREADMWAGVLSRLISAAENAPLALRLYSWVADGLSALIETTRETGGDGVLGWTSNPDVFTLGIRVIRGAEILIRAPPSENLVLDKALLRRRLEDFLNEGQKTGMHHCWLLAGRWKLAFSDIKDGVKDD
ncbi:hypothetical protein AJ79_02563 [Helicocarpus griseus UAMH5409]|uniref:Uncharacterized protein n=1 Tax=Helicocarpus griseus UAMH5409 TaxID=1447875 RepID=A0A2B7Y2Z1_9EURO|nr:hypothetical protein AJ79_02563 [Helicocarpus griseus UAMH5409]